MRLTSRVVALSALLALATAVATSLLCVEAGPGIGGGYHLRSPHWRPTPVPPEWGHLDHFPTHEELAADPLLRERYGYGDKKITVHVVPHTHDDVGWLKTVDQYYLGYNNSIQTAAVHWILDTVIEELQKNPARKFIYVEQAFFQLWWPRQTAEVQEQTRKLVANGQLEFINGGWCMHDEAAPFWVDMVDQTTLGHQFIMREFGPDAVPKIGWQIDPFGHSATQASLLSAGVGFEGLFFGRMDHQDHDYRMQNQNMEFMWQASPSLPEERVFTGAFQSGNYGPPDGFCFDVLACGDPIMITDKSFIDYNVPRQVQNFLDRINYQESFTLGGANLMITMGSDFQYTMARSWFQNLDKLIDAVNADGRITMQYSTPSLYVEAKMKENLTFTTTYDDFFPYADDDASYWTGYFTSRPALKRYVRTSSALLQISKQLELIGGGDGTASLQFEMAQGVSQHHDAVSGTSKQHVAFDYAQRLHLGQTASQQMMATVLANLTVAGLGGSVEPRFAFCELLNISVCAASAGSGSEGAAFQVLLYNPQGRARTELVTFPIWGTHVAVYDENNNAVSAQVLQVFNVSSHTTESATYSLNFMATVPGVGYATYFVTPAQSRSQVYYESARFRSQSAREARMKTASTFVSAVRTVRPSKVSNTPADDVVIENALASLTFSGSTGEVSTLTNKASGLSSQFSMDWGYYQSWEAKGQKSGAYIFRPAEQAVNRLYGEPTLLVQKGPLVQEVTQVLGVSWLNQTFRLVQDSPFVSVEFTVGPIPIDDNHGKEVVVQYNAGALWNTADTWFADSNGREMIQRIKDYRPTWKVNVTEPIAGNYVPVNMAAYISDGERQFTVLTDRSQGCVSLKNAQLEVMVHRRTLEDDSRGVGEPLNETSYISPYPQAERGGVPLVITGTHHLYIEMANQSAAQWRPQASRIYSPLLPVFASLEGQSVHEWIATHNNAVSYLGPKADLPLNVDLVTLAPWAQWSKNGAMGTPIMLRLAHMFAKDEDAHLSGPVTIDLDTLFGTAPSSVQEMSLTVTRTAQELADIKARRTWRTKEQTEQKPQTTEEKPHHRSRHHRHASGAGGSKSDSSSSSGSKRDNVITLNAMEIKTYLLTFN